MAPDQRIRIFNCHLKSTELLAQTYLQLRQTEQLRAVRKDRSLKQVIQETRAMRAEAQMLMVETRQLVSRARAAVYLAGRD